MKSGFLGILELVNNFYMQEKNLQSTERYYFYRDWNFWGALLSTGLFIIIWIFTNPDALSRIRIDDFVYYFILIILIPLGVWETWIILKKGRKGSLIVGFLLAVFAFGIIIYLLTIGVD